MIVVVDTPIWSLMLRRKKDVLTLDQRQQLRRLLEVVTEGRARLLGAVRQELLSGIRSSEQFARLRQDLRSFPDVELEVGDYETAAEISNRCRAHGVAGGPVDFLLCSVALRRNWAIFTSDRDFARYAKYAAITLLR
jgi:hypothetical protein